MKKSIAIIRMISIGWLLCLAMTSWADPLDITFDDPTPQPVYLGFDATFAIRVEPTLTSATINGTSATIGGQSTGTFPLPFDLVSHNCPGNLFKFDGLIQWTGMGAISSGNIIDCSVTLRPISVQPRPYDLALRFDCNGCNDDPDDRDSASTTTAVAGDIQATLAFNTDVQVGTTTGFIRIENVGDATMQNILVGLFGDAALFNGLINSGGVGCQFEYTLDVDSASWTIPSLDRNETVSCPFVVPIPASGMYDLNLLANGATLEGRPDPWPDNNTDSLTFVATEFVVDTVAPLNPDANPGDGVCDDGAGNCSLRTAIDESNALAGTQTVLLPYRGLQAYTLSFMPTALTITDPVRLSGIPDETTGELPIITRGGSTDVSLIVVDTSSPITTTLANLDLRGNEGLEVSVDGAVVRQSTGVLGIQNSKIRNGWTSGGGGGIRGTRDLFLTDVEVFDNRAGFGGGLYVQGVADDGIFDGTLTNVAIHDNIASGNGGGLLVLTGEMRLQRSSVVGNQANQGGGLFVSSFADVNLRNSTISENAANTNGGGIFMTGNSGLVELESSTLAFNQAAPGDASSGDGGGIYMAPNGTLNSARVRNSIIANNTARTSNGGPFGTIVSGNCFGTLTSQGWNTVNVVSIDPECGIAPTLPTDAIDLQPALAPLEFLPTGVAYHRLTRVNQEIDQANPACQDVQGGALFRDITGAQRPQEGDGQGEARCDKGAHESRPLGLRVETTADPGTDWTIDLGTDYGACDSSPCLFSFIPIGSSITLTPQPGTNTTFDGWGGDCAASGAGPCTLSMPVSRTVSASFSLALQPLPLSVSVVGSGSVTSNPAGIACPGTCTEDFLENTLVTLTAQPDPGFELASWSGACSGSGGCQVTMDQARNVTATFQPAEITLTLDFDGPGGGNVLSSPAGIDCTSDCSASFPPGTVVELTPTADPNNRFQNWTAACGGTGTCAVTLNEATTVGVVWADDDTLFIDGWE